MAPLVAAAAVFAGHLQRFKLLLWPLTQVCNFKGLKDSEATSSPSLLPPTEPPKHLAGFNAFIPPSKSLKQRNTNKTAPQNGRCGIGKTQKGGS